jgi:hypothetical protein
MFVWLACAAAMAVGARYVPTTILAQSHWESYKARTPKPSVDQRLTDPILNGAIDLHAHHGPDAYGRQWDAFEVAKLAKERGLRAIVLKNHWTETAGYAWLARKYATPDYLVFGAASLDTPTGGLNPMTIRYMQDVEGNLGRIVWFPTHDVEQEVKASKDPNPRPWVVVSRNGQLVPEVFECLDLIGQFDLTLAIGHVTPAEGLQIIPEAKKRNIQRIIVTHPSLAGNNMWTIDQLKQATAQGAYVEFTAGSVNREGEGRTRAINTIRAITPAFAFVSSDSGLIGTPNHPDALAMAIKNLRTAGFNEQELSLMFRDNTAKLIKLPVLSSGSK